MSNETKQEVFNEAVNELEDVLPDTALFGSEYIADLVGELRTRYATAMPDYLPVIPKEVADWIEKCKNDGTSVGDMLCSERRPEKMRDWMALTPGTYEFNQRRYKEHQELVAHAWLDGYQVEGKHD